MLDGVMSMHDGKKWINFPASHNKKLIWEWLRSIEDLALTDAPYKLHTSNTANRFKERIGQMDIFFQAPSKRANGSFKYDRVLVVGKQERSNNTSKFKSTILQLARYIRGVFTDQPTRRFVHAFSICASTMELWVFDRSGPYSSGPFNIHRKPDMFARALVGYATMNDDEMGLDTFIKREDKHRYITLEDASGNELRTRLEKLLVKQHAIVCRGTTCFKAGTRNVAKFSWVSDKQIPEATQLELAEERGVKGVARVVAHRRITTIADMRKGMHFPERHRFRNESMKSSRKEPELSIDYQSDASGPKRRRINRLESKQLVQQLSTANTRQSLNNRDMDLWENRIFSCLIVSPAGRIISDFKTTRELLESMQDAIKAHQSLYVTGNILHRDIPSSNIIITNPKVANGFKGMLIDLDLAKL
ncbi:hypothetical protein RJ55_02289 [Drechmeria coniospora]|nr:hypothetical protein RJ55_02289 [Drechmeria coniospora]